MTRTSPGWYRESRRCSKGQVPDGRSHRSIPPTRGPLPRPDVGPAVNRGRRPINEGAAFKVDAPVSYIRYNVIDVGSGNTISVILLAME